MVRIIVGSPVGDPQLSGADGLARALRDAGHEVVWVGADLSPEQLAVTAVQEDVALVAIAVPPGDTGGLERDVADLLATQGAGDIGVRAFPSGTSTAEVTTWAAAGG